MSNSYGKTIRVVKDKHNPYLTINVTGARDKRLSNGAKGLLWYALSHSDNWVLQVADVVNNCADGEHAVRTVFNELKKFGYLKRERVKAAGGRFEWETTLYETPQGADFSHAVLHPSSLKEEGEEVAEEEAPPSSDFPHMENPRVENPCDGKSTCGKPPDIRSSEERSIKEEVLKEVVVVDEPATKQTPPPPPPQTNSDFSIDLDSPIIAVLSKVCGISPANLGYRNQREVERILLWQWKLFEGDEAAAAEEIRLHYTRPVWTGATAPYPSQINPETWARQSATLELQSQPTPEVKPTNAKPESGRDVAARKRLEFAARERQRAAERELLADHDRTAGTSGGHL